MTTFVGLRIARAKRILNSVRLRLEDVSSGYWTPPAKRSSGLVNHRSLGFARDFGSRLRRRESASSSSPSSSARPSTLCTCQSSCGECYNSCVRRWRTNWQRYEPRMTTGAFDFCAESRVSKAVNRGAPGSAMMIVFGKQRTNWQLFKPRLTSGAFEF